MKLEDLEVYTRSMELGETVWALVHRWGPFARFTVGRQLVRACDSVAANLSEGFGRYHFRENRQFCYYARGSLYETKTWLTKAHRRRLINNEEFRTLRDDLNTLAVKLNNYIKTIGKRPHS